MSDAVPRESPEHFHPILIQLAKNVKWLLEQSISVEREQIQLQYIQLLTEHNLTTIMTRNVHRVKLKKAVLNYYPPNLLKILGCDIQRSENWLLNWKTMEHPLHHLLLIQFLCENPQKFLLKHNIVLTTSVKTSALLKSHGQVTKSELVLSYAVRQGNLGPPFAT